MPGNAGAGWGIQRTADGAKLKAVRLVKDSFQNAKAFHFEMSRREKKMGRILILIFSPWRGDADGGGQLLCACLPAGRGARVSPPDGSIAFIRQARRSRVAIGAMKSHAFTGRHSWEMEEGLLKISSHETRGGEGPIIELGRKSNFWLGGYWTASICWAGWMARPRAAT